MFYEGINAKVFRRSIAFAIAVVVTSRSSSFEYTISVHAVHAGVERNACTIVVSTDTPQTPSNPSQTLLPIYNLAHLALPHPKSSPPRPPQPLSQPYAQMRYRCKYQVSSTGPNILEVSDVCQVFEAFFGVYTHLVPRCILGLGGGEHLKQTKKRLFHLSNDKRHNFKHVS